VIVLYLLATPTSSPSTSTGTAGGGDGAPWWVTILVSLVVGLGSGLFGAWIAAKTQKSLARETRKAEASKALWAFQRGLHDYASEGYAHFTREFIPFTETGKNDLARLRAEAYPYRGFLGSDQEDLVKRMSFESWDPSIDPMDGVDDMQKWADSLEKRLVELFDAEQK
jgi:hypothetical protein